MSISLVTGGAGFIGSHLVDGLIAQGHSVVIFDDLSTGFQRNIHEKATFIKGNILDAEAVASVFSRHAIEQVFHLAAQIDVRKSTEIPTFDAMTNINGSLNLIQAALHANIKKMIYISTGGAVYGRPGTLPVNEQHPVNPLCPYGISKHTVEHYLHYYCHETGLNYTVLRLPNVYGPRQNPEGEAGVVAIFIRALLQNQVPTLYGFGKATRDYVYVGDVVRAILLAQNQADGLILNLGWGKEVSVQDIYDTILQAMKKQVAPQYAALRAGEISAISLDATFAKNMLGWQPEMPLSQGIQNTVDWITKQSFA